MAIRSLVRCMNSSALLSPILSRTTSSTPSSHFVCNTLRKFSTPTSLPSLVQKNPSILSSETSNIPFTAMKLLGNIIVCAKDDPKENWAWAFFGSNIISSAFVWFVGHKQLVTSLDFCSDRLISGSLDGTCRVWDTATATNLQTLDHGNTSVNCIQVQGYTLASGTSDTTASIWDLKTYTREYVLSGHIAPIQCIAIDGNLVATGSDDTTCRIWSTDNGRCERILKDHTGGISCLQMSNGILVTGSLDKSCKSWDPETGELLQTFQHDADVLALEFEDNTLATVTADRICTIWDLKNGSTPVQILKGHTNTITCMRLQGDTLVTGSLDRTLRVWNLKTGESDIIEHFSSGITRLVLRGDLVIVGLEYGSIVKVDISTIKSNRKAETSPALLEPKV